MIDERDFPPIRVRASRTDYDVVFTTSVSGAFERAIDGVADPIFVVDARVAELYPDLRARCGDRLALVPANEAEKSLAGLERLALRLAALRCSKKSTLVAIGGGIVQDIATFAAATFHRGIGLVIVPTTLLAIADSCIGSKYGVNLGSAKNQLGGFWAPDRVVISAAFLETLTPDDLRSGFGEIVKLALIGSSQLTASVLAALGADGFQTASTMEFIRDTLLVKRSYIEDDEFDTGRRKILNFGHTFAHALESITKNEVPHGMAVAWGVDVANHVACEAGLLERADRDAVTSLLRGRFGLSVRAAYDAQSLVEIMRSDKKAASGSIDLVLMHEPGDVRLVATPLDRHLIDTLQRYLSERNIFVSA